MDSATSSIPVYVANRRSEMRYLQFIFILISVFCVPLSSDAQAQDYNCADLTNALDLSSLCEEFTACDDHDSVCLQKGVVELLQECDRFNLNDCEIRSIVYWVMNHHIWADGFYLWHPDGFEPSFRAVVSKVDEGDYEGALLELEDVTQLEDYAPYFTLELAHGILYYAVGAYQQAFEHVDNSIDSDRNIFTTRFSEFDNPLAYYFRGQIYRKWGNEERALQDFYLYDALALPELKALLPLAPFNLNLPNPQSWTLYPVFEQTAYGGYYRDLSEHDPQNILISFGNNRETIAVVGLLERRFLDTPETLFLERDPDNPSDYYLNLNKPDYGLKPDTYHLKVTVKPDYIEYYETVWDFEGTLNIIGIILPIDAPDIRQNVTNRNCRVNTISFINIGDTILNIFYELPLMSNPMMEDDHTLLRSEDFDDEANPFVVIDGPVCDDAVIWWQVSNGTLTGWLAQNDIYPGYSNAETTYVIMPRDTLESWQTNEDDLRSIVPTPLQFLGLTNEIE